MRLLSAWGGEEPDMALTRCERLQLCLLYGIRHDLTGSGCDCVYVKQGHCCMIKIELESNASGRLFSLRCLRQNSTHACLSKGLNY